MNAMMVRMLDVMKSISPQKPCENCNSAQENPRCIGAHVSGLHVPQTVRAAANELTHSVDCAINHDGVHEFPKEFPRCTYDCPDDHGIVELVHVILVHHDRIH